MDTNVLYESEGSKIVEYYESLYEGLEAASKNGISALNEAGVNDDIAEVLYSIAKDKIVFRGVTVQGVIEMTSLNSEGVEDIKVAFVDAAEVADTYESSINITTMGAPKYRIELTADDYKKAELALDKTVSSIRDNWEKIEGSFSYKRD